MAISYVIIQWIVKCSSTIEIRYSKWTQNCGATVTALYGKKSYEGVIAELGKPIHFTTCNCLLNHFSLGSYQFRLPLDKPYNYSYKTIDNKGSVEHWTRAPMASSLSKLTE